MAENNTAARVLEVARGELGATSGDKYIKYYNELTGIGLPYGVAWCAAWVTWVMRHAGVPEDSVLNYKGCTTASTWFAKNGRFMPRAGGYIPRPGDIIMYEWNPEDENTSRDDGDDHTGIVERVENGKVYTIEGNNGGMCRRDWWGLSNDKISGYCLPLYNIKAKEEKDMFTYEIWKEFQKRYEKEQAARPVSNWAREDVEKARAAGIMVGDSEGGFRPQSYITRQEAAVVVNRALKAAEREKN